MKQVIYLTTLLLVIACGSEPCRKFEEAPFECQECPSYVKTTSKATYFYRGSVLFSMGEQDYLYPHITINSKGDTIDVNQRPTFSFGRVEQDTFATLVLNHGRKDYIGVAG
jgi:hypothetical protein